MALSVDRAGNLFERMQDRLSLTDRTKWPNHTTSALILALALHEGHITQHQYQEATFPIILQFVAPFRNPIPSQRSVIMSIYEPARGLVEDCERFFGVVAEDHASVRAVFHQNPGFGLRDQDFAERAAPNEALFQLLKARGGVDKILVRNSWREN